MQIRQRCARARAIAIVGSKRAAARAARRVASPCSEEQHWRARERKDAAAPAARRRAHPVSKRSDAIMRSRALVLKPLASLLRARMRALCLWLVVYWRSDGHIAVRSLLGPRANGRRRCATAKDRERKFVAEKKKLSERRRRSEKLRLAATNRKRKPQRSTLRSLSVCTVGSARARLKPLTASARLSRVPPHMRARARARRRKNSQLGLRVASARVHLIRGGRPM